MIMRFFLQLISKLKFIFSKNLFIILCVIFPLFGITNHNVYAKNNSKSVKILEKDKEEARKVERYINSIKTIKADFVQIDNSNIMKGKFLLRKPDKLKLDYRSGSPVTVLVNGSETLYYDRKLQQLSKKETGKTIASIILTEKFNFKDGDVEIVTFKNQKYGVIFGLRKVSAPEEGTFTLFLKKQKNQQYILNKIQIKQPRDKSSSINLTNVKINEKINSKEFNIEG